MDDSELMTVIYKLVRDPLEYILLIFKHRKLPTCLAKYIIITHFMPNHKIIYENILLNVDNCDYIQFKTRKRLHIDTHYRKNFYKICEDCIPNTDTSHFYFQNTFFSKKFIMNFLNLMFIGRRHRFYLADEIMLIALPLHLQKKFNKLYEKDPTKIQDIIKFLNKIHVHNEKINRYKYQLRQLDYF